MFSFLNPLKNLIDPLERISKTIAEAKIKLAQEQNNENKIIMEQEIKSLELRQEIILKSQSDPHEKWIRIGFAFPFIVYIWKLIIYDKVLSLGVTDPLSQQLSEIMFLVLGAYFLREIVKQVKK